MLQAMRNPVVQRTLWITIVITFVAVFIFAETSGLLGRSPVTRGTEVGKVNGEPITYDNWIRFEQSRLKQMQEQRGGQSLTLDETKRLEDQSWNELVGDMLLQQEIGRRGIGVTNEEIVEAAQFLPPPEFRQNPEFQTEGRFDLQKYQRFLKAPIAKQQGILAYLESYYRTELPKQKLYEQIAATVYVPDSQLWWLWQIGHDSAQVTFAEFRADSMADSTVKVSDEEIRASFEKRKDKLETRPGHAVFTIASISRTPSAADTAATRAHAVALRDEILKGAKFDDVAKRESADSASATQGGSLGKSTKGQYVAPFENAAYALKPGELSSPVLSPFGFHIIRVDERKGDTLTVRHILLKVQQADSVATHTDKLADDLAKLTANADVPAKFDAAVKQLGIPVVHGAAVEGEPLQVDGHLVPSASAWAFNGATKVGETSDIYDAPDGYYIVRLDSLTVGGKPTLASMTPELRSELAAVKKVDIALGRAKKLSDAIAAGQTLDAAAAAQGVTLRQAPMFNRITPVSGMGQVNEAVGAAFGLNVGQVSAPIRTQRAVYVERLEKRVAADRAEWEKQKVTQRQQVTQGLRQQRVRDFLTGLHDSAKIADNRKDIAQRSRGAGA